MTLGQRARPASTDRSRATHSASVAAAVSTITWSRSHGSYSRLVMSCQGQREAGDVAGADAGPALVLGPVGADDLDLQVPAGPARATRSQASRVIASGLTESATTDSPWRR